MDKLNIANEMAQLDRKQRDFYDGLTTEERKKFSLFLMLRWSSAVQGECDLQEYYVQSCNHYLNRDFFSVNRHPKLQWLMATAVSPGLGTPRHVWISPQKKVQHHGRKKQLADIFPTMKSSDIEVLAELITDQDIKQHERDRGN